MGAAAVAVLALAGCQVRVAVDTHVERDGHGLLTVGVGLDDQALAQVGDLDRQVRVGDLAGAGWQGARAEKLYRELAETSPGAELYRGLFRLYHDDAAAGPARTLALVDQTLTRGAPAAEQGAASLPAGDSYRTVRKIRGGGCGTGSLPPPRGASLVWKPRRASTSVPDSFCCPPRAPDEAFSDGDRPPGPQPARTKIASRVKTCCFMSGKPSCLQHGSLLGA